jgi:hypothetical protein
MTDTNEPSATQYSTINDRIRRTELANLIVTMQAVSNEIEPTIQCLELLVKYYGTFILKDRSNLAGRKAMVDTISGLYEGTTISETIDALDLLFREANLSISNILNNVDIKTDISWLEFEDNFNLESYIPYITTGVHMWHYILETVDDLTLFPNELRAFFDLHDSNVREERLSAFYDTGFVLQKSITSLVRYSATLKIKESLANISPSQTVDEVPMG